MTQNAGVVAGLGPTDETGASTVETPSRSSDSLRQLATKLAKTLVLLGVVSLGVWKLVRPLALSISTEAVVGARVTTLRAPIDGFLKSAPLELGSMIQSGADVANIDDQWADDRFLRETENRLRIVEAEITAATPIIQELEDFGAGLKQGSQLYQARRVTQLSAIVAEAEAKLAVDRTQAEEADRHFRRTEAASAFGVLTTEKRAEAERDWRIGEQRVAAAEQGLEATRAQLTSAREGVNIDSSGTGSDRPYSRQRLDEVKLELVRWRQQVDARTKTRDALRAQLDEARARYKQLSAATIQAPRPGRVWRIHAAANAFISRGQPIVSLLDCDSVLVVALVPQRVFGKLRIGAPARFKLESGERFQGHVTQLIGQSPPSSEDTLIAPGLIGMPVGPNTPHDQYQIVVSFPELAKSPRMQCTVGQSGEVSFD